MPEQSLLDTTRPNPGRIYDYLLGGHHNFEIDRMVAEQVRVLIPFLPKAMRMMRWCLQDIARTLTYERGYRYIIDFASGLPTMGHLHTAVAPGTVVIYSDRDPICVEYSKEILGDTPNVYYFQADCRRPEELLNRPEVQEILGDNRRVAFVYWGITMFMTNEDIAHVARVLYEWSDEASCWAISLPEGNPDHPGVRKVVEIYHQMGEPVYYRPLSVFRELVQPWRPDELGFRTMEEWHGLQETMTEEDKQYAAAGGGGYGVYLIK
ncbi:MAG: SAM-dependent methyltransferase [Anaerolineae bacterium]|nr:SAM-dependent methyltransferase [Anaerolineae bacterium]